MATYQQGLGALGPQLRAAGGLTLPRLGLLIGSPLLGFVLTLYLWGVVSDRFKERYVLTLGLMLSAGAVFATSLVSGYWPMLAALVAAGAAGASVNSASGRMIMQWFPDRQRGLAMGLRQTAIPLGAMLAALTLPWVAAHSSLAWCFRLMGLGCLVAALVAWCFVREPPGGTEVRRQRIGTISHAWVLERAFIGVLIAGSGLVVCQATVLSYLTDILHTQGATIRAAAIAFAAVELVGGIGRTLMGAWSDRTVDRLTPLRVVAVIACLGMGGLGLATTGPLWLLFVVGIAVGAVVVCWNGLTFAAAGELAPPGRTGSALGIQSTVNFFLAGVSPYPVGGLMTVVGLGWGLGILALLPAIAWRGLAGVHDLRRDSETVKG